MKLKEMILMGSISIHDRREVKFYFETPVGEGRTQLVLNKESQERVENMLNMWATTNMQGIVRESSIVHVTGQLAKNQLLDTLNTLEIPSEVTPE